MGLFDRVRRGAGGGQPAAVPVGDLEAEVARALGRHRRRVVASYGDLVRDNRNCSYGLTKLRLATRDLAGPELRARVEQHVAAVLRSFDSPVDDARFADVRHRVRARLYDADTLVRPDTPEVFAAHRLVGPGLLECVVLDLPDVVRTVSQATLADWGLSTEAALDLGRAQTRADGLLPARPLRVGADGVRLVNESFLTTTHVWWLQDYLPEAAAPGAEGALVMLPNRHVLVALPLTLEVAREGPQRLWPTAAELFLEEPGGVSPHLWWWRRGRLTHLPLQRRDDRLILSPPPDYRAALERLAG